MGLTGLEIFKLLPKTNCKECGAATCLAFAMSLATGKTSADKCPHLSEEAKEILGAASAPPIALVRIGTGEREIQIGNESVLFRHDKRFENPCAIAVLLGDNTAGDDIYDLAKYVGTWCFERMGSFYGVDLLAVENRTGDAQSFAEAVGIAASAAPHSFILMSDNPKAIERALPKVADRKPLIGPATAENYEQMAGIAKTFGLPLAVKAGGLDELAGLSEKIAGLGVKDIVLYPDGGCLAGTLYAQTQIRRLALKKFRAFGYPTIAVTKNSEPVQAVLEASVYICKYAGIVVIESTRPEDILSLITLRLNIYTDPQKPAAVEPKIYEVLSPGPDSPVYITTNFSLTFYCVAGDVEASKVPGYILPVDTDGVSVLTGWAAGKFTPEKIAEFLQTSGIGNRVSHRKVIIPGTVAVLCDKLEEISGWKVLVGPRESTGIPAFIKNNWK